MASEGRKQLKECREEYQQVKKQKGITDDGGNSDGETAGIYLWKGGIDPKDAVPSQDFINKILLEKKKKDLLGRFG